MRLFSLPGRHASVLGLTCLVLLGSTAVVRGAAPDPFTGAGPLDLYTVLVDHDDFEALVLGGFDIVEVQPTADPDVGQVTLVMSASDRARLDPLGVYPRLSRNADGLSYTQSTDAERAEQQAFNVWRPYDGENGIQAELDKLAADHPDIVKRVVIGKTLQGRDIVGLKVTKDATTLADGTRPAVMYNALQHAREWIATEVNRRLLHHFVDNYSKDTTVTELVDSTELWFVPVANPDGYMQTFTEGNRLWRKNMRDNNGDAIINAMNDGVDPNRNFAARWNYDTEGSSGAPGSQTYRGPSPASEPEVAALQDLLHRVHFTWLINYHSAAELILYPDGWQDQTRVADDPIFTAVAGDYFNPAIEGFLPELSSGLYITNGETCDYADASAGTLCITPELSTPPQGSVPPGSSGFEFPDNEELIQAEFLKNVPFALDIAKSAANPSEPVSHLGNTTQPMYTEPFPVSFGDPQPVQAKVQRKLGDVTMAFRIGSSAVSTVPAVEWEGGERYGDTGDVYYRRVRGTVTGAKPGDDVTIWFEAGGQKSAEFSYRQVSDSGVPVLVVAAEDHIGTSPVYAKTDGPSYLDAYKEALEQNDYSYDVYDVDANDRRSPSQFGVLGHYKAVIWYTGDDIATRTAALGEGNAASREMVRMMLAIRGYLNEGGKVMYTGKHAGGQFMRGYQYDPVADAPCLPVQGGVEGCEQLSNDFMQYYMGGYQYQDVNGVNGATIVGSGAPFDGMRIKLDGPGGARMDHGGAFGVTSQSLPVDQYPIFTSRSAASYENAGTKPHTGEYYMYSGPVGYQWQRLSRTVDLRSARSGKLEFWVQRQTRSPFDATIVEARMPDLDLSSPTPVPSDTPEPGNTAGPPGQTPGAVTVTPPPQPTLGPMIGKAYLPALHNGAAAEGGPLASRGGSTAGKPREVSGDSIVRARAQQSTQAQPGWTTLPDANGHTSQTAALSCTSEQWYGLFPQLVHYMSRVQPDPAMPVTCEPKGTTGVWHAATGASDGWELWSIDLSGYAGQRVELSITHLSSRIAFPGAFVDDVTVSADGQTVAITSFEDDLGGWAVSGLDVNNQPHDKDFQRVTIAALPPITGASIVATTDSLTFGFGFEVIATREDRVAVLRKALEYLGVAP